MERLQWLGVVRHGQSTGNVIAEEAEAGDGLVIEIPERDADVPLSGTGHDQARALGEHLAKLPADDRPTIAIVSPYLRARQTAEYLGVPTVVDERLRDRELGVLDLLTGRGVRDRLPDEFQRRARLGKFYYRPPGGESWADVLLRLRALLRELREDHPDGRVMLVAHDAVVMLVRYLAEGLGEAELMEIAHRTSIANASLSSWRRVDGELRPELFNAVDHLERAGAPKTEQENVDAEPN